VDRTDSFGHTADGARAPLGDLRPGEGSNDRLRGVQLQLAVHERHVGALALGKPDLVGACADGHAAVHPVGALRDLRSDPRPDGRVRRKRELPRERRVGIGLEDSILAPLPAPPWTLSCGFDEHFTDGEHVFHAVTHCVGGSRGVSETATVIADRGVPVGIRRFGLGFSDDGVLLYWNVDAGPGLQGFNIYKSRRQHEYFVRINTELISAHEGNTYTDGDVEPGTTYWYCIGAVYADGEWMSTTERIAIPTLSPVLRQNIPNPFNPTTSISFTVPARSRVRLDVYDVEGRHVKTLFDDMIEAGTRSARWDGTNGRGDHVGSGVYFYQLRTAETLLTRKMVLLK
jgi:hypothetical protein